MTLEEATAQLHKAIVDHAVASEELPEGAMLSDFVAVSYWALIEDDGTFHYHLHRNSLRQPAHVAAGLLTIGEDLALSRIEGED